MSDRKKVQGDFKKIMEEYHSSMNYTAPEDDGARFLRRAWFDLWELFEPLIEDVEEMHKDFDQQRKEHEDDEHE